LRLPDKQHAKRTTKASSWEVGVQTISHFPVPRDLAPVLSFRHLTAVRGYHLTLAQAHIAFPGRDSLWPGSQHRDTKRGRARNMCHIVISPLIPLILSARQLHKNPTQTPGPAAAEQNGCRAHPQPDIFKLDWGQKWADMFHGTTRPRRTENAQAGGP